MVTLQGTAEREVATETLYTDALPALMPVPLRAIPYAWWGNRGAGEMRIWIRDYEL